MQTPRIAVLWLRRDLRLRDQTAWMEAARASGRVHPAFVLDPSTFEPYAPGLKPHAAFFGALLALRSSLRSRGKDILLVEGDPAREIPALCESVGATDLFFNKDYEPSGIDRDESVSATCKALGIRVHPLKDHVLFEEREILSGCGEPYRVFTPYKNAVLKRIASEPQVDQGLPDWEKIAVEASGERRRPGSEGLWEKIEGLVARGNQEATGSIPETGEEAAGRRLARFIGTSLESYELGRNIPSIPGTSRISMDLRSGAISPRQAWNAIQGERAIPKPVRSKFLGELLWRDFFIMVGFTAPRIFGGPFKERYSRIRWRNDEGDFKAWREGRTGYPIVDAGMRELTRTGFMHNRVRMIAAMFLVKDLLIDWRWGERFFLSQLLDGDRAVNNGNWQWCASTGCDAQPYFRIFNPTTQARKFDPDGEYVRAHIPELAKDPDKYPPPCVDHAEARTRCLMAYNRALGTS